MKQVYNLVVVAVFLLGVAAGWVLRVWTGASHGANATGPAVSSAAGVGAGRTGGGGSGLPDSSGHGRPAGGAGSADKVDGRAEAEQFLAGVRRDMDMRLADWVGALGLAPGQVARLRQVIDNTMAAAATAVAGGEFAGPWVDGAALTEALDGVLDDAQRQRWHDWQERRRAARVEARASAGLAEVEGILLLDPPQREAVREVMARQADAGAREDGPPPLAIAPEVMAEIQRRLGPGIEDPVAFERVAREVTGEVIAKEVEAMRGVLRPEQLEAYRVFVTRKHAAWLDSDP